MSDNNPFNILPNDFNATEADLNENITDLNKQIENLINSSDIFLFMKGNAAAPQCGFSANTVGILNQLQKSYKTFDILTDPAIREGVKQYSNWPTYPQLYFKGKLLGGNDIISEMFQSGDLEQVLNG